MSATVIIRSHRPLSDALDRIQKILLKSINFWRSSIRKFSRRRVVFRANDVGTEGLSIPHRWVF